MEDNTGIRGQLGEWPSVLRAITFCCGFWFDWSIAFWCLLVGIMFAGKESILWPNAARFFMSGRDQNLAPVILLWNNAITRRIDSEPGPCLFVSYQQKILIEVLSSKGTPPFSSLSCHSHVRIPKTEVEKNETNPILFPFFQCDETGHHALSDCF